MAAAATVWSSPLPHHPSVPPLGHHHRRHYELQARTCEASTTTRRNPPGPSLPTRPPMQMKVRVGGLALVVCGAISASHRQEQQQQQRHISTIAHLAAGGFAGVVTKTCISILAHSPSSSRWQVCIQMLQL